MAWVTTTLRPRTSAARTAQRGRRHRVQQCGRQPRRRLDAVVRVAPVHGERRDVRHLRRRVQGGDTELGHLLQARRGRDGRGNGLGPEHGQLRDTYTEVTKQVTLTAGKHVLRISTNGYHNLCCMKFTSAGTSTPTPPITFAGATIPGIIQAENYNTGGEGVAYHDTTSAQTRAVPTAPPRASTSRWRAARAATWSAGSGPASGSGTR